MRVRIPRLPLAGLVPRVLAGSPGRGVDGLLAQALAQNTHLHVGLSRFGGHQERLFETLQGQVELAPVQGAASSL